MKKKNCQPFCSSTSQLRPASPPTRRVCRTFAFTDFPQLKISLRESFESSAISSVEFASVVTTPRQPFGNIYVFVHNFSTVSAISNEKILQPSTSDSLHLKILLYYGGKIHRIVINIEKSVNGSWYLRQRLFQGTPVPFQHAKKTCYDRNHVMASASFIYLSKKSL